MAIWLRIFTSFLLILSASFTFANELSNQERISKGMDWLLSQQLTNGAFTSDVALDWQSTDEVITALKASDSWDQLSKQSIFSWWILKSIPYIEYQVRSMDLAGNLGETSLVSVDDLITYQNIDGGFSAYDDWESDPYSTAQALSKLTLVVDTYRSNIVYTLEYLRQTQRENGSFLTHQNESSLILTARLLIALKALQFEYAISEILEKSQDYLLTELTNAADYSIDEVAVALLSVIPVTTDTARYQGAVEYLLSSQQDNGSWNNDTYISALALQALQMIENAGIVIEPLKSTLQGQIYIYNTNTVVANTIVSIEGTSESVTTDTNGQFQFNNLEEGGYSFIYSASGYYPIKQTFILKAGQLADIGSVYLTPLPIKGTVKGVISSAETGLPLQGVQVNVLGVGQYSAITAANGSYQTEVMPGAISFNTTFDGYQAVAGSVNIKAGESLVVSASLYKDADELPKDVTVRGKVLTENNQVIAQAQIFITGAIAGQTNTSGEFNISGISAGAISLQVSADNYRTKTLDLYVSQVGKANLGDIVLEEYIPLISSTIEGKVVDGNGEGVPFSNLVFNQLDSGANTPKSVAVQANQYGDFKATEVDFLSTGIEASAVGFVAKNLNLQIAEHGNIAVGDISLERTPVEEVTKIRGFILNKADSAPIPFADILLTQLDVPENETPILVSVTANSDGEYTVGNIKFYRMQAFVTATGYQSLIQELTVQQFDQINADLKLQPYVAGSVLISELELDQSEYPGYSEINIQGILVNTDVAAKRVKVQVDIKNSAGESIQQILIGDEKDLSGKPLPITVVPNTPVEVKGNWFVGINQPGRYEVVLSLYDPLNNQLLSRKSNFVEITETTSLNSVSVFASPEVSKVGEQETLNISAVAKYFGNVASMYTLNYELLDPDDQTVSAGNQQIRLVPGDISKAIQLPLVNVVFSTSGRYLLRATIEGDPLDVNSDWIIVTPST